MNARTMRCLGCGWDTEDSCSCGPCPACGRSHWSSTSHRIWKQVSTLLLIRAGETIPPYRTSPAYGRGSRGDVVTAHALARRL